jgi:hypothetical protein
MRIILRSVSRRSCTDDGVVDHLQRNAPGGHRGFTAGFQHAQGLDHSITAFGRDRTAAREGCVRGILSIQIIIFAALAAIVRVGRRDLQNLDASVMHIAQEPRAIGARRLDADATELPVAKHLLSSARSRSSTTAAT